MSWFKKEEKKKRVFDIINEKINELDGIKIIIGRKILKHVIDEVWDYKNSPTIEGFGFLFDRFVEVEVRDDDQVQIYGAGKQSDVIRFLD